MFEYTPNRKCARTPRAAARPHRHVRTTPSTFLKGQITNFLDHAKSSLYCAFLNFGGLRHFGVYTNTPRTSPATTTRRRPEKKNPPRKRPCVPTRPRSEWAVGMAGRWCSSRARARSCGVSRREAQGRLKHKPPQRRGRMWLGMWDAPRGTGSVFRRSMIALNVPRRLRRPNRAGSMRNVNNNS